MFLYNITLITEDAAAAEFLLHLHEAHHPEIMATDLFVSGRILRVVDSPNEGVTFCLQYVAESMEDYQRYQLQHAPAAELKLNARFPDKFVSFSTLMEYIA